jgi:hypothetical protein
MMACGRLGGRTMFGWFASKDWNVVAIMFERHDLYRINGNRGQGKTAETMKRGAAGHNRTILWAVFDQKGALVESGPGAGKDIVPLSVLKRLTTEIVTNRSVRDVLRMLESKQERMVSRALDWQGYPSEK